MSKLLFAFFIPMAAACQDTSLDSSRFSRSTLSGNTSPAGGDVIDDQGSIQAPAQAPVVTSAPPKPPEGSEQAPPPSNAMIPISIGGASLTCSVVDQEDPYAHCRVRDALGQPLKGLSDGYLISGPSSAWLPVSLVPLEAAGEYKLPLNNLRADFGIVIVTEAGKGAFDWIDPLEGLSHYSVINDGGFEKLTISPGGSFAFIPSSSSAVWKAVPAANSNCVEGSQGIIEVQNQLVPGSLSTVKNSKQWIELDAACADVSQSGAGNMRVYQDVKVKAGNIYQLRFSLANRPGNTAVQSVVIRAGGAELMRKVVTESMWSEYSLTINAVDQSLRLEFEETGVPNRHGTLLDNVELINLGSPVFSK